MDSDDLVRRITQEVARRLGQPAACPAPAAAWSRAAERSTRVLVLLTGGNRHLDEVLAQVGRIAAGHDSVTVALSPSAEKVIGVPAVRRTAPGVRVVQDGDICQILDGVGLIYLPNLSLNAAGKIGSLTADSFVCILAVYGLLRGIPLIACRDCLLPQEIDPAAVPPGVREKLDRVLRELEGLGVCFAGVDRLSEACGAAASQAIASPTAAPHHECAVTGKGECVGCGKCVEKQPATVKSIVAQGAGRIGASMGVKPADAAMARMIDHTLLKPDATEDQFRKLCEEARQYNFASVCVNPSWVALCAKLLAGTPVKVCTVIGFPLGATTTTAKAIETRDAIANGATEVDMVINVGALKSGNDEVVRKDIEAVVTAAKGKALSKVILETALLSKEEIVKACLLAKMAGADFVKTSTGFSTGGATVEDIALMRETVGPDLGVKASGGIRDRATAEAMIAAGATRIGASASVAIASGQKTAGKGY